MEPDPTMVEAATAALRGFSADFYRGLAPGGAGQRNVACSPYSVAVALAMARAGAKGVTGSEMDAVLHAPEPAPHAPHAGINALDQLVIAGYHDPGGDGTNRPRVAVANSLWVHLGLPLVADFVDTLAGYYGASAHPVDFTATESARQRINAWIGEHTDERIPELLVQGALSPAARLVLANAIYLKARWRFPFDPRATRAATFTRDDHRTTTVPMMSAPAQDIGYQEGDGWLAVDIPYVGSQLAMAVVVPMPGALAGVEATMDGPWLTGLLRGFRTATVDLRLPRFNFRFPTDLGELLIRLGMPTAFTDRADFSGITRALDLLIDKVIHETFIGVDEAGTEAAAATAVIIRPPSMPIAKPVLVDRPFLFVIHDVARALPLFVGRVTDPETSQAAN